MELQGDIRKDDCKCIIKDDEPLITLAKEKRACWCGLLKQRVSWCVCGWLLLTMSTMHLHTCVHSCVAQNPNVAFDFDHWEECEEDSPFSKGEMGFSGEGRAVRGDWVDTSCVQGVYLCGNRLLTKVPKH